MKKYGRSIKNLAAVILIGLIAGCAHRGALPGAGEAREREYSSTAITLSDCSMTVIAHYQSLGQPFPADFAAAQFFQILEGEYPNQDRLRHIRDNYKVVVRPLNTGYSVMLCDSNTDAKVMEDLSCHVNRVEILSWQKDLSPPCAFEKNWQSYCP